MELRKCCNHPFLIAGVEQNEMEAIEENMLHPTSTTTSSSSSSNGNGGDSDKPIGKGASAVTGGKLDQKVFQQRRIEEGLIPSSGKMVLLDKLLPKLRKEGHKVCIVYVVYICCMSVCDG